jgi:hypothetical protein
MKNTQLVDNFNTELPGRWCYVIDNRGRFMYFGNCYWHFMLAKYQEMLVYVYPNTKDMALYVYEGSAETDELICTVPIAVSTNLYFLSTPDKAIAPKTTAKDLFKSVQDFEQKATRLLENCPQDEYGFYPYWELSKAEDFKAAVLELDDESLKFLFSHRNGPTTTAIYTFLCIEGYLESWSGPISIDMEKTEHMPATWSEMDEYFDDFEVEKLNKWVIAMVNTFDRDQYGLWLPSYLSVEADGWLLGCCFERLIDETKSVNRNRAAEAKSTIKNWLYRPEIGKQLYVYYFYNKQLVDLVDDWYNIGMESEYGWEGFYEFIDKSLSISSFLENIVNYSIHGSMINQLDYMISFDDEVDQKWSEIIHSLVSDPDSKRGEDLRLIGYGIEEGEEQDGCC